MKNRTVGILGVILFISSLFLILADNFQNELLLKLADYGKYFAILGGALIGVGFFGKKKTEKPM